MSAPIEPAEMTGEQLADLVPPDVLFVQKDGRDYGVLMTPQQLYDFRRNIITAHQAQIDGLTTGRGEGRPMNSILDVPEDTLNRLLVGKATGGDQLIAYSALTGGWWVRI